MVVGGDHFQRIARLGGDTEMGGTLLPLLWLIDASVSAAVSPAAALDEEQEYRESAYLLSGRALASTARRRAGHFLWADQAAMGQHSSASSDANLPRIPPRRTGEHMCSAKVGDLIDRYRVGNARPTGADRRPLAHYRLPLKDAPERVLP